MTQSHLCMIAVLGLGRTGRAVCTRAQSMGISFVAHDDRLVETGATPPDNISLTAPEDWPWEQLDGLVISPGIPHHHPTPHPLAAQAKMAGIPIMSEIEFALKTGLAARFVTITGTNGKSTITALIGHILSDAGCDVAIGGNLGNPISALPSLPESGIYVGELSSYQLETTPSLVSDCAVISNITPDHLDRHDGFDGYVAAKKNALLSVRVGGLACLGAGAPLDKMTTEVSPDITCLRLDISSLSPAAKAVLSGINNTALSGPHNTENIVAAILVCQALGVEPEIICKAANSFTGLPHRMQPAGKSGTISFVNDSKATNAEATARALDSFDSIWWCAGGIAKESGISACLPHLTCVRGAFLYGESAPDFAQQLSGLIPVNVRDTLEDAVRAAFSGAAADTTETTQTILLSPAAASFDQFSSFEARGEAFCSLARELICAVSGREEIPHA